MKRTIAALFGLAVTLCSAGAASAQETYPNKMVRIILPFSAGGSTDLLARNLADRLGVLWKQSVIVENRAGAAGIIGSDFVAKSSNDGYTILLGTATTHAVAQTLYPKLPYDVQKDFVPITELVNSPQLLSVHPSLPVKNVQEFVAYAKANPEKVIYGGGGGSSPHMAMEMLASKAGVKMLFIPYKGSGPAMIDLLSGTLNAGFDVVMTTLPHMQKGKLRTIAVTGAKRSPLVPQIPTVAEQGFPGFEANIWFGLFAPAGTPPNIVKKIAEDTRKVMLETELRTKLEGNGFEIVGSNPQAFGTKVKDEVQKWRKVIVDNGIKVE